MGTISIKLESKKYCCQFDIKEKVTFILGESGKGKTEFTRRVTSGSSANSKNILLLVDYCAFGSNISDLINLCEAHGLKVGFVDKYKLNWLRFLYYVKKFGKLCS